MIATAGAMLSRQMESPAEASARASPPGLRARLAAGLKRPVQRAMDGIAWRVDRQLGPRLDDIAERLHARETSEPPRAAGPKGLFPTFDDLLHAQRSAELSQMPRGVRVLLSAGCSGNWYFDWIEAEYGRVERHVGVERYLPQPDHLPVNVEWIAASIADVPVMADGSVDLLFSGQNIEHLFGDDCPDFLVEAARLVRPGGHLVMDSPHREIARLLCWSMSQHTVEFTPEEAAELVTLAGFDVTSLRGVWLSREPDTGEVLPLDPFEHNVSAAEVVRRIQLAARYPEHSFVWWLEAQRADRPPDHEALRRRHAEVFAVAWPERTNRLWNQIGEVRRSSDGAVIAAPAGTAGYLILGPCMPLAATDCHVGYTLLRPPSAVDPNAVVAVLDVVAGGDGDPVVALREVRAAELREGTWTRIDLSFRTRELRWTGEFRVYSTGVAPLEARLAVELDDPDSPVRPTALRQAVSPPPAPTGATPTAMGSGAGSSD